MTETSKVIFEKFQVRKTKKQKTAFIKYVKGLSAARGYDVKVEKGSLGARNIVVGDPDTAKVIYTAHYDTSPVLPFPNFITPKNIFIYILYNIALAIAMLAVMFTLVFAAGVIISLTVGFDAVNVRFISMLIYWAILLLLIFGPANKHTANDNTSGVTTLIDLMSEMPEELRRDAAFVFFDLEEVGLFGSRGFASKHKAAMKNKLLVNFDCVSDGENVLIVPRKGARGCADELRRAYESTESISVEVATKSVFYPSDQACFPCGVGVAALKKTKRGNILYMNRIHTNRDVIYREENIEFLVSGSVKLTKIMSEK